MESLGLGIKEISITEKKCYSTECIKRTVIIPAQKCIENANLDKEENRGIKYAHRAFYHLKKNEEQLHSLCNGVNDQIYCNDKQELEDMIQEYKKTIESLKVIVDAYKTIVNGEVGLINKSRIKAHLGNLENNNDLIDKINLSYLNPLNDMMYGWKLRFLLSELVKIDESNSTSLLSKYTQELKYYLNNIMDDVALSGKYPAENEVRTVQSDFENLLKLYENLLNEKSSD